MRVKLSDIEKACGGTLLWGDGDTVITGFFTDSRQAQAGTMFVPIRGERTDGHAYIPAALEAGASASFTDHPIPEESAGGKPVLLVKDCREALQKTAAWYRDQFPIPIVGITGSVGKTTAKEMVAQALTAKFRVLKTAGNQNSQIGVPLTVCGLKKDHTAAVVEMGVSMPGEMARIAGVVKPTCGVMTNIGVSHLEFMKTRENILKEKSKIADYLPEDGFLFVNGDDDLLPTLKERLGSKVVTFGLGPHCDWRAYGLKEADKGTFFTCQSPTGERTELFVPAAGEHNVRNALVSMAVARSLGRSQAADAARALSAYKAPAMRQQVLEVNGLLLIDDSYNASPDSVRSALDVLATRKVPGRRVAVLADMLELGELSQQGHRDCGEYARKKGVDLLVAVGPLSQDTAGGYGSGAQWFGSNQEAIDFLKSQLRPGDAVLVKGSRGMRADQIVQALSAPKE